MSRIRYCCGFAFDVKNSDYVYLIEKEKPDWQKGLLNGVGGKIEFKETPLQAMVREFREETGHRTLPTDWRYFCYLEDTSFEWEVFFFVAEIEHLEDAIVIDGGEIVRRVRVDELREGYVVSNLFWLLPLARYPLNTHVVVQEKRNEQVRS